MLEFVLYLMGFQLELELVEGATVWRAIVDGSQIFFFEAEHDLGAVELMSRAIDVWLEEGFSV